MGTVAMKLSQNNLSVINLKSQFKVSNSNTDEKFNGILNAAKKQDSQPKDVRTKEQNDENIKNNKVSDKSVKAKPRKEKEVREKATTKQLDDIEKVETKELSNISINTEEKDELGDSSKINVDEKKLEEISEKLGLDVEALMSIMQNLNINASDLKDIENVKNIIKDVFKLDSSEDILKDTNVSDVLKEIKSILDKSEIDSGNIKGNEIEIDIPKEEINIDKNKDKQDSKEKTEIKSNTTTEQQVITSDKPEMKKNEESRNNDNDKDENKENKKDDKKEVKGETIKVSEHRENNEVHQSTNNNQEITVKHIHDNPKAADINNSSKIAKTVDTKEIMKQVIDKAKVVITEDKSEMVIRLKPDHLGKLTLKIVTEEGMVTAKFDAENQKVKEIIEQNLADLKQSLKEQGLQLNSVEVSVGQDNSNEQQSLFKQEVAKTQAFRRNLIDRLMNEGSMEGLNINDTQGPNVMTESSIDYIA